jgi:hypothetical protein
VRERRRANLSDVISYNCKKAAIICAVSKLHQGMILKFKGEKELQLLLTWDQADELVSEVEHAQQRREDGEKEE